MPTGCFVIEFPAKLKAQMSLPDVASFTRHFATKSLFGEWQ
jgi:hypothetical protein